MFVTPPQSVPIPLATHLVTPPFVWAHPLWYDIRPHAHTNTLRAALLNKMCILLVSDASIQPDGTGTCAWTIWANSEVWSGKGYVPSPVTNIYSSLAKAYGIYTMLSFLSQYLLHYPMAFSQLRHVHVYCDNSGVIARIQNTSDCPYPRDAICDDYPIFTEIQSMIHTMPTIQCLFHHVKGHQHETADWQLTLPEQLNINCDTHAAQLPPPLTCPFEPIRS